MSYRVIARGLPRGDYYRGDYYQGDYYRGDPGFFSFIGGLAKRAIGGISHLIGGSEGAGKLLGGETTAGGGGLMKKVGPIVTALKQPSRLTKLGAATAVAGGAGIGAALARHGRVLVPKGAGGRHHRRMNVTNPRALRRAIRRTHGFAKLAMKTIHLVHPKKKVRFGGFKKRRARR
jgi:hypothetical protein